jgi:hypothetical protein
VILSNVNLLNKGYYFYIFVIYELPLHGVRKCPCRGPGSNEETALVTLVPRDVVRLVATKEKTIYGLKTFIVYKYITSYHYYAEINIHIPAYRHNGQNGSPLPEQVGLETSCMAPGQGLKQELAFIPGPRSLT